MSDREHAEEILETARRDLRALRAMSDTDAFPDEIFGFHAQQSVEKALKAWLAFLGIVFPKTHDLKRLIDLLGESGVSTGALDPFVDLNSFAVQYRYESLYADEEPIDRPGLAGMIELLIVQVAGVFHGESL
jgi:HEPN domain-containing protein